MKIITTNVAAGRYFDETAAVWKEEPDRESGLVTIYPEKDEVRIFCGRDLFQRLL